MTNMPDIYQIRVQGHFDRDWSAWFEGMTISNQPNGEAVLLGPLVDQAALYGLLIKIRDLGLPLLAVARQRGGVDVPSVTGEDNEPSKRRSVQREEG
jgi:hypothetical protein